MELFVGIGNLQSAGIFYKLFRSRVGTSCRSSCGID